MEIILLVIAIGLLVASIKKNKEVSEQIGGFNEFLKWKEEQSQTDAEVE